MDVPSVYNVIMGRPIIHKIQGVVSTYHQMMIYVSDEGRSERIQGSQKEARRCNHLKPSKSRQDDRDDEEEREKDLCTKKPKGLSASAQGTPTKEKSLGQEKAGSLSEPKDLEHQQKSGKLGDIDSRLDHEESSAKSMELDQQTESIESAEGNTEKCVSIGLGLDPSVRIERIQILRDNKDVFAFSAVDILGIDPNLISHKLNVDSTCRPVKKKKRNYSANKNQDIAVEVKNTSRCGFH